MGSRWLQTFHDLSILRRIAEDSRPSRMNSKMWRRMRGRPLIVLGVGVFALAVLAAPVSAQIIEPRRARGRYQQLVWNDQHGLPQNGVHTVTPTRDGYLWLGTDTAGASLVGCDPATTGEGA